MRKSVLVGPIYLGFFFGFLGLTGQRPKLRNWKGESLTSPSPL